VYYDFYKKTSLSLVKRQELPAGRRVTSLAESCALAGAARIRSGNRPHWPEHEQLQYRLMHPQHEQYSGRRAGRAYTGRTVLAACSRYRRPAWAR